MNSAAKNTAAETLPTIVKALAESVAFQVGPITFGLVHTTSAHGVNRYDLSVEHVEGGSTVYELTHWRGEWLMGHERGDAPLNVHRLALALLKAFNVSGYYQSQTVHQRYSLAEQVARIDLAVLVAALD